MRVFKVKQVVKRVESGEPVTIISVLPMGLKVFYRIEYENGRQIIVPDDKLREVSC